jgi:hypothetical protein
MKITYDKRTYFIEDGDKKYEVVHIVKHPNKEYDTDTYYFYEYRESDIPDASGYWHFEPSEELVNKIKDYIKEYEQTR